jgi:hypothetical protein
MWFNRQVINMLKESEEFTDDEIANKTGIRLNSVRKILYKLYDHSLVSLRRTRDPKTGWFIFHWRLQSDQLEGFIQSQKRRVLEKLLGGKVHNGEPSEDMVEGGSLPCFVTVVRLAGGGLRLGHLFLPSFVKKAG